MLNVFTTNYWLSCKLTCVCFYVAAQLGAFDVLVKQMLEDVQERLVYRTHIYIQTDITGYNPAPGDLAYPEKLEMMEVSHVCWKVYRLFYVHMAKLQTVLFVSQLHAILINLDITWLFLISC